MRIKRATHVSAFASALLASFILPITQAAPASASCTLSSQEAIFVSKVAYLLPGATDCTIAAMGQRLHRLALRSQATVPLADLAKDVNVQLDLTGGQGLSVIYASYEAFGPPPAGPTCDLCNAEPNPANLPFGGGSGT